LSPSNEESDYKRKEDREWQKSVDNRIHELEKSIVVLTSAQNVTSKDLEELEKEVGSINFTIQGDKTEGDLGLIGQVNTNETALNSLLRVMHPDKMGHGGMISQHNVLWDERDTKKRDRSERRTSWTAITIAIISTAGLIFQTVWPKIVARIERKEKEMNAYRARLKKGPPRNVIYKINRIPAPRPEPDQNNEPEERHEPGAE
jgi:hypothetical protein